MTVTFSTQSGSTTLSFSYIAPTQKMVNTAGDAAHLLWDRGLGDHGDPASPILWDDLSNQERADILDVYWKGTVINLATQYRVDNESGDAATQAQITSASVYNIT